MKLLMNFFPPYVHLVMHHMHLLQYIQNMHFMHIWQWSFLHQLI